MRDLNSNVGPLHEEGKKKKRHSFHSIEHLHFLIATPGPEGFDPALAEISTIQYKTWPLSL